MNHQELKDWFAYMKSYIKFSGFLQDLGFNGNEFSRWFNERQSTFTDEKALILKNHIKSKIV